MFQGSYEAAKEQATRAAELDPTFFFPQMIYGWVDINAGKFTDAYSPGPWNSVTQGGDDPLSIALHRLIDHVAEQDRQIEMLQQALERMGADVGDCCEPLDAGELSRIVD